VCLEPAHKIKSAEPYLEKAKELGGSVEVKKTKIPEEHPLKPQIVISSAFCPPKE